MDTTRSGTDSARSGIDATRSTMDAARSGMDSGGADTRRSRRVMPIVLATVLLVLIGLLLDRTPRVHEVGADDHVPDAAWTAGAP